MKDDVDAATSGAAGVAIGNARLDQAVPSPGVRAHGLFDFLKVGTMAGGEVVQAHDVLAQAQQMLDQVRADEARASRHEPRALAAQRRHTSMPRARSASASAWFFTST